MLGCVTKMHWFSTGAGGIGTCRQLRNEKKSISRAETQHWSNGTIGVVNVDNIFQKHVEILGVVWLLPL